MAFENNVVGFEDNEGEVKIKTKKSKMKSFGFSSLNLSHPVVKGIKKRGYKTPTPIQKKCIPMILEGRDVVAMARTGSGKTAAFLVPIFEKLRQRSSKSGARSLILSPTRELALQTYRFIKELGKYTDLKATVVLGGDSMDQQFSAIHGNPDILVATPGRFLHLCIEMDLKLTNIEIVVFDEADRLFEMGFGEQLHEIIYRLPDTRQTLLFSATLPKLLVDFAKAGLHEPALVRLDVDTKLPESLKLCFLSIRSDEKTSALLCLLNTLPEKSQTVVFVATKHHVEYLHMLLENANINNTIIHSNLDPTARKINAARFQNGNVSVLLVTDVAARGIDIPKLDFVVNYHFPTTSKLFVHRVGRCARAGRSGTAYSLVSPDEYPYLLDLHLFLGRPLNLYKDSVKSSEVGDGLFARIPQGLLEEQEMEIKNWHYNKSDLESMKSVCSNSYKLYIRCRPGASVDSVRRVKEIDFSSVITHPVFGQENITMENDVQFLNKMKNFKPNGTIFELNMSSKAESYSVMKATRKAHQSYLKDTRREAEDEPEVADKVDDGFKQTVTVKSKSRKRKSESNCDHVIPTKKSQYYIPHFASDHHSEIGLSVSSFANDAKKLGFDLTDDSREGIYQQKKLNQKDKIKKKKKDENSKVGKIKTESGAWIPATYKSKRYAQWKEKSKSNYEDDDDDDESDADVQEKNKFPSQKSFPNTHWGRHNRKLAEKLKAKSDVKKPEQILKARLEVEKRKQKSRQKNHKKRGGKRRKGK